MKDFTQKSTHFEKTISALELRKLLNVPENAIVQLDRLWGGNLEISDRDPEMNKIDRPITITVIIKE
jgi:hypothetical protein